MMSLMKSETYKRKNYAKKEEIAKAKNFLEDLKVKILRRNQVETRRYPRTTEGNGLFQSLQEESRNSRKAT